MSKKVFKPRCPNCHKRVADWVISAGFTCRHCGTVFTISTLENTDSKAGDLTSQANCVYTLNRP